METNAINHSTEEMTTDIEGRVYKIKLSPVKCLMPLFEAIVNSIHAIEDLQKTIPEYKGQIDIYINRERENKDSYQELMLEDEFRPIQGFTVVDNGIGFNKDNYISFKKSDSTYKKTRGGQGIGRFVWLKAFEKVRIYSRYKQEDTSYEKNFTFALPEGIYKYDGKNHSSKIKQTGTIVELIDYNKDYFNKCSTNPDVIAQKIIEHCLSYFMKEDCPTINLIESEIILLNEEFKKIERFEPEVFELNGHNFKLYHLKLETAEEKHRLHLCAHNRDVDDYLLNSFIPCLNKKIKVHNFDEKKEYFYKGYISSDYLDKIVNDHRSSFEFKDQSVSLDMIKQEAKEKILEFLKEDLKPLQENTYNEMQQLVKDLYEYKHILKYKENEIKNLPQGISKDKKKAKIELIKLYADSKIELEEEGQELFNKPFDDITQYPEYKEKLQEFISKHTDFTNFELSNYIIHRNLILQLLDKNIKTLESGKYALEESIHSIIFPLGNTSNDIDCKHQNLWVIDERLSYHQYLASDKPIKSQAPLEGNLSQKEPDITIYDNPISYSEEVDYDISSIFIIEFKRAEDVHFSRDKNDPVQQVLDYIEDMQEGKKKDKAGQTIQGQTLVDKKVPFYAYIICNCQDPTFKAIKKKHELKPTPDREGFFKYHSDYNAYIEVITYKKLLRDAKRRNRILFEKLGLPN